MTEIGNVRSQHSEAVSFLWELRTHAVVAPHYHVRDLAKLDQRIDAHLDGLRIAGDAGWNLCREALAAGESGEAFAAAVLAFESDDKDRVQNVLEAGIASPDRSPGVISALGWLPFPQAEAHIKRLISSSSSALQRIGIAASAIHRQNPGSPLVDAISGTDPLLRRRALRAIGELGLETLSPELRNSLGDEGDGCGFRAAWSLALLSPDPKALAILESIAESKSHCREAALHTAIRRMDASAAAAWLKKLSREPTSVRQAIIAAGALGDPANIPWLMEHMSVAELARVAGEAFAMITGVDIAYEDLDARKPEGFEAGPTEDPKDTNVEMDPDEHLPWPNRQLIGKWWSQRRTEFRNGVRYLIGKPISVDWCEQVLRTGRQRQRAAAALELAILRPGQPLFNVAAPGFRQRQILGLRS